MVSGLLELDRGMFSFTMWVLRTESGSPTGTASTLNAAQNHSFLLVNIYLGVSLQFKHPWFKKLHLH